jgi:phosphoserine phosphatase RsbU/P
MTWSVLEAVFERNHQAVSSLAEAWLGLGARSVHFVSGERVLAGWPSNSIIPPDALAVEIHMGIRCTGTLHVSIEEGPGIHTRLRADAEMLSQLAGYENDLNQVVESLVENRDQLAALYKLTQSSKDHFDLQHLVSTISKEVYYLLQAEGTFMAVCLPDRPLISSSFPSAFIEKAFMEELLQKIQRKSSPFLVINGLDFFPNNSPLDLLLVPINGHGIEKAALGLFGRFDLDRTIPMVKFCKSIAQYAGGQVENILNLDNTIRMAEFNIEMELARKVQASLLPAQIPYVPDLDIWALSRPASQVGGDFYDLLPGPGQTFTLLAGDVSGKGIPAAILMAMTRTLLRSLTNVFPQRSPKKILGHSGADLYRDFSESGFFCSVFIGQYNPATGVLTYANAGHSPVVYRPKDGKAGLLRAEGYPLGISEACICQDTTLQLAPGDVLVVGSDGLTEAQNCSGESFGYNRLLDLIGQQAPKLSAKELTETILDEIDGHCCGVEQNDDQTLVVVKVENR